MALLRPRGWTVQIALLQPLAPAQDFEARAGSWRSKSWQWAEEGGGGFGLGESPPPAKRHVPGRRLDSGGLKNVAQVGATSTKVCATEVEAASVFQSDLGQHNIAAYENCQN